MVEPSKGFSGRGMTMTSGSFGRRATPPGAVVSNQAPSAADPFTTSPPVSHDPGRETPTGGAGEGGAGSGEGAGGGRRRFPSILIRVGLYLALVILTLLALNPVVLLLSMFMLIVPALILMAAPWVLIYLPLVDWPLTAWRLTRNPAVSLAWLSAALVLPLGVPLVANAFLDTEAAGLAQVDNRPAAPLRAGDTLFIHGEPGECGRLCQALLWSGATDHVLVAFGGMMGLEDVDRATLYTVSQGAACQDPHIARVRNGYCLVPRPVTHPTFNRAIGVSTTYFSRGPDRPGLGFRRPVRIYANGYVEREPFWRSLAVALAPRPGPQDGWTMGVTYAAYACGETCELGTHWSGMQGQHMVIPFHFDLTGHGIDSTFGLHPAQSEFYGPGSDPNAFLRAAFGADVSGFHPRPGFAGDVEQGNPGRLTGQEIFQRRRAAEDEVNRQQMAVLVAKGRARCEQERAAALARIAKWQAFRAAHPGKGWTASYEEEHPPEPCR